MFSRSRISSGKSIAKSLLQSVASTSQQPVIRSNVKRLNINSVGAAKRSFSTASVAPSMSVANAIINPSSIYSSTQSKTFFTNVDDRSLSSLFNSQSNAGVVRSTQRHYSSEPFDGVEIDMPALSPTMESGNIVEWVAEEGQAVSPGDVLCRIETDKATMDFESPEEGFLAKILVPGGTDGVQLGQVIALLVFDEDEIASAENYKGPAEGESPSEPKDSGEQKSSEPEATPASSQPASTSSTSSASSAASGDRVLASPAAKYAAKTNNVDLSAVSGTGPNDRVIKADIQDFLSSPNQGQQQQVQQQQTVYQPLAGSSYTDHPISNIRKVIATRLTESKQQVPHYYLTVEFPIDDMLALRKRFNQEANGDFKLSVNDFVIKAASMSMNHVPEVNSAWMPQENVIRQYENVDVNVAVNTDRGLMIPLVTDANYKGLAEISDDVKRLAAGAQAGTLSPDEMVPGTFTISNLGMFGIKQFTAVINPPQAAILAVGGADQRLAPTPDGGFTTQTVMTVTLSCDHRVVDGAVGAEWLQHFSRMMKDPSSMLL